jgi:mannose-6-phosphate isomerase-like protein (cupin superfamily)
MPELKYAHRIITDAVPHAPEVKKNGDRDPDTVRDQVTATHIMNVDASRVDDFFYVDAHWLWRGGSEKQVELPHTHDFDEVLCFVGSRREDPWDLGGEISIRLDDEPHVLKRSCLIYIPAGTRHCPIQFTRVDTPILFASIAPTRHYSRSAVGDKAVSTSTKDGDKPRCTIIDHTKEKFTVAGDPGKAEGPNTIPRDPSLRSTRLLHLEDDMARGAFYVDFVWLWEGNGGAPAPPHDHSWPEMIAFAGVDPEHPHDLGCTMTIVMDGDTYEMKQSSIVCIPAHVNHCPWKFHNIVKPTIVFTAGPSAMYSGSHKEGW